MTAQHTPGKLIFGIRRWDDDYSDCKAIPKPFDYTGPGYYENPGLYAEDGTEVVGCDEYFIFNSAEDARRLVACWNAFEGYPIEFIEELAQIGGVSALTIHANDLREKRDELLAALVLARNEVAYMASGMTHAGWKTMEAQKALSVIDAAIQKATKEQV